ncbi:MAG: tRNA (guanosine(46)-N7)-methyltransferase TrmB [Candidatus Obscuribacterales bacterium]|nr:tRNA (guanosine(46)-N7)-methyltransferase TrmB [Steroidobacteraceae bacterium]
MTDPDESNSPSHRAVRSFVIRTGRMTAGQARALAELWPRYGIDYTQSALDLAAGFGRSAPCMIEIGFGAGEALLAFAQQHPDFNCLGIEVHRPGAGRLLMNAGAAGLQNLRVATHDAVEVMQQLNDATIDRIHIFFPDPWHKKRHNKRRLIQAPLVHSLARILKPGGVLRLATDWHEYALQMREVIDAANTFRSLGDASGFTARPHERPITRFERRGHRLGHGVWDLAYVRL